MKLSELASQIGAELVGADGEVHSAATLEDAEPGQIAFLANPRYAKHLETTRASAVILSPRVKFESDRLSLIKARDPYYSFQQAVVALHGFRQHPHEGIHPRAHVEASATVGEGSVIYPGAYVGANAKLGRNCIVYANATIYDGCVLGERVIIHSGAAIGADGYGYATHDGVHHKIPQVGNVILEDDVEIGANSVIARAALGSTIIGKGTKIDALVMIGHNVKVGEHGLLVAQVGIAGSATLGHHVTLAGQVGVAGHVKLGDKVTVGAQAGVVGDLQSQAIVMGSPAMPVSRGRRVYTIFTQLPELLDRIKRLEEEVGTDESGPASAIDPDLF